MIVILQMCVLIKRYDKPPPLTEPTSSFVQFHNPMLVHTCKHTQGNEKKHEPHLGLVLFSDAYSNWNSAVVR